MHGGASPCLGAIAISRRVANANFGDNPMLCLCNVLHVLCGGRVLCAPASRLLQLACLLRVGGRGYVTGECVSGRGSYGGGRGGRGGGVAKRAFVVRDRCKALKAPRKILTFIKTLLAAVL